MNLPILTSAQMRAAEKAAFARGVEVEALMDKAGTGVAQAVTRFSASLASASCSPEKVTMPATRWLPLNVYGDSDGTLRCDLLFRKLIAAG